MYTDTGAPAASPPTTDTADETAVAVAVEPAQDPIPEPVFELNGLPVYLGTKNLVPMIVNSGRNHFYVLAGYEHKWVGSDNKQNKMDLSCLFRVTNTAFGMAMTPATPSGAGLPEQGIMDIFLNLPKIPYKLHQKMDAFFRAADKKHSTEAILMLVYDTSFLETENPGDGWGAIAPEQSNTAHDCKYEPESVLETLGDGIFLVGSAHSHPHMSAYASGTDHNDQAGWDGIHLTYGWQASVNRGATQLYHEVLYAGYVWKKIQLGDIVELYPQEPVSPEEIEPWLNNVSKKVVTTQTWQGGHVDPKSHSSSGTTRTWPNTGTSPGGSSSASHGRVPALGGTNILIPHIGIKYPEGAPSATDNVIVGIVNLIGENPVCPHCKSVVGPDEIVKLHRCYGCMQFIGGPTTPVSEYNNDRIASGSKYIEDLDVDNSKYPILLYHVTSEGGIFSEDQRSEEAKGKV